VPLKLWTGLCPSRCSLLARSLPFSHIFFLGLVCTESFFARGLFGEKAWERPFLCLLFPPQGPLFSGFPNLTCHSPLLRRRAFARRRTSIPPWELSPEGASSQTSPEKSSFFRSPAGGNSFCLLPHSTLLTPVLLIIPRFRAVSGPSHLHRSAAPNR